MKSKWTTYVLLTGVLAIWGVIAWKMFMEPLSSKDTLRPAPAMQKNEAIEQDTLYLEYADPFLERNLAKQTAKVVKKSVTPQPVKKPEPVKAQPLAHNVRHIGNMKKKGILYCLAEIEGEFVTMSTGDVHGEYRLVKIFTDSAQFAKGEGLFTVKSIR